MASPWTNLSVGWAEPPEAGRVPRPRRYRCRSRHGTHLNPPAAALPSSRWPARSAAGAAARISPSYARQRPRRIRPRKPTRSAAVCAITAASGRNAACSLFRSASVLIDLLVRRDVCDQVRALRSSCSARRQRPPGLAGPASDDDLPLPQVDVARLGVLRVVADRGWPRAGCPVAPRRRPGGRPGFGPSPPGLTAADSKCMGARGWTAVAENHRDGDQSDGGEKPGQDRGSLQAATAVRRFSAAPARAAAVRRVAQR